jgi:ATP-dependent Clp protease ATP-binding subunit ClpA
MVETAQRGKLDPVIGREEEIRRVIQVLSRRRKNNPLLLGDHGHTLSMAGPAGRNGAAAVAGAATAYSARALAFSSCVRH